jgi:polyhydroxyalkanoate synthase
VTAIGTPFDVTLVPLVAPFRPLLNLTDGRGAITRAYQAIGGAPKPVVRWAFQLSSFQKLVTKPLAIASNLDDRDYLAQLEAVDRFTSQMTAYPGRTFGQLYHRFVKGNALRGGSLELSGRTISVADIEVPVLVFAGATDGIAPVRAVEALVPLLTGSREARFEIVPGGHLGMLTGRAARDTTWRVLDEWVDEWSTAAAAPARKPAARKPAARKPAARKAPVKKAAAKRAPVTTKAPAKRATATTKATAARKPATKKRATKATIGTNPTRRYGSSGSRAL